MKRILVGDDDASLRIYFRRLLERLGYRVEEAENGTVSLDRLYREQFDGAVLDVSMGQGPTGLAILETLRKDGMDMPVIILSADLDEVEIAQRREKVAGLEKAEYIEKDKAAEQLQPAAKQLFG